MNNDFTDDMRKSLQDMAWRQLEAAREHAANKCSESLPTKLDMAFSFDAGSGVAMAGGTQSMESRIQWIESNFCDMHKEVVRISCGPCTFCENERLREAILEARRLIVEVYGEFVNHQYSPAGPMPTDGSKDTLWMKEAQFWLACTQYEK